MHIHSAEMRSRAINTFAAAARATSKRIVHICPAVEFPFDVYRGWPLSRPQRYPPPANPAASRPVFIHRARDITLVIGLTRVYSQEKLN
jgi:hypothetical protein